MQETLTLKALHGEPEGEDPTTNSVLSGNH